MAREAEKWRRKTLQYKCGCRISLPHKKRGGGGKNSINKTREKLISVPHPDEIQRETENQPTKKRLSRTKGKKKIPTTGSKPRGIKRSHSNKPKNEKTTIRKD